MKCARVTGNVASRWHPHGTSAIYDALTRMAQPFSLRHPLIDFHGNYGSPDFDAAADRYTECRLSLLAMQLMAGIDEDTVNFIDNYSGEFQGPEVLPARFPNLLVNGSQGIAVGMATNIPPHNLGEVIDAVLHLIDNPEATPDELMQFVKGPDFPTGGSILGRAGIIDAYRTGRGSVRMRATAEIEEVKDGSQIVVTELPYQTSATAIAARIGELANEKTVEGIRSIDNFSSGDGTRLVIGLKRDANALVVLNNLYKHTPMQSELRDQHGRPRRRRASHVEPGVDADRVRRAPGRGHHPPFRVPPPQGTRSRAHRRGIAPSTRRDRRDHRLDPRLRRPRRGSRGPHGGAVRVHRRPGEPHPRPDARSSDPARSPRARGRDGAAARDDGRARGDPRRRRQAARRHQDRARRGAGRARHPAHREGSRTTRAR